MLRRAHEDADRAERERGQHYRLLLIITDGQARSRREPRRSSGVWIAVCGGVPERLRGTCRALRPRRWRCCRRTTPCPLPFQRKFRGIDKSDRACKTSPGRLLPSPVSPSIIFLRFPHFRWRALASFPSRARFRGRSPTCRRPRTPSSTCPEGAAPPAHCLDRLLSASLTTPPPTHLFCSWMVLGQPWGFVRSVLGPLFVLTRARPAAARSPSSSWGWATPTSAAWRCSTETTAPCAPTPRAGSRRSAPLGPSRLSQGPSPGRPTL